MTHDVTVESSVGKVSEPDQLICSITHVMYRDPVFVPESGNTYERDAIENYWKTSSVPRDPLTNSFLESTSIHTNWGVRREVQRFLDENPNYSPQGWPNREVPAPRKADRRRSQVISPRLVGLALGSCFVVSVLAYFILSWFRSEAGVDYRVGETILTPPRGSRLQATTSEINGGLLSVRLPPRYWLPAETLGQLLFSIFWLGFVGTWTCGAVRAGAPVFFCLFSIPFWGVGGMMFINAGMSAIVGERLLLAPGLELASADVASSKGSSGSLWLESEVFGWRLSHVEIALEDLGGPPRVNCDASLSCQLVFESVNEHYTYGHSSNLKRDEARWLQKLLRKNLVTIFKDVGLDAKHFEVKLSERKANPEEYEHHRNAPMGFGGFSAFGGGFTFVVR